MIADTVVKIGGSLARDPFGLRRLVSAVAASRPLPLCVPGGGALADAVRTAYASGGMSEETGHRMALLALDQAALWLVELAGGAAAASLARSPEEVTAVLSNNRLPVMAPSRWLQGEGELPASWQVTSDAIAAWAAARVGARRLLVLKSFAFPEPEIAAPALGDSVDAWFLRALPPGIECRFLDGRDTDLVSEALHDGQRGTLLRVGAESAEGEVVL